MSALLPCPFCGGSASIERFGNSRISTIYACDGCGCTLETGEEWDHGRRWNDRSTAPARPAEQPDLARETPNPQGQTQ